MNIQQLRYVLAIANNGTFREAAHKMFVSQPSLSVAIRDLEKELGFQIFNRTNTGAVLTTKGMAFYDRALKVVKQFDEFENDFIQSEDSGEQFSIASQHYDFLPPLITEFSKKHPELRQFRLFESTTVQILHEVSKNLSQIGIIYMNHQNESGLYRRMEQLGLETVDLISFQTHIYLSKSHPLASKEILKMSDLKDFPTIRFIQEKDEYLYYSENLVDTSDHHFIYHVSDRATLNGILERTDAYATGSGFLDHSSVNGITVVPLEDRLVNKMVYVKRKDSFLSSQMLTFIDIMIDYFEQYKF